jgi:hypothetical protein
MSSSGLWRRVGLVKANVSEEPVASNYRAEKLLINYYNYLFTVSVNLSIQPEASQACTISSQNCLLCFN